MSNYIAYCRRGMAGYWLCFLPAVYLLTEFWLSLCFCFLHMSCWQSYKNVKLHLKSSLALRKHLSWLQKKVHKRRERKIWSLFRMCNWNRVYETYLLLSQSNLLRPEVLLLHRKQSIPALAGVKSHHWREVLVKTRGEASKENQQEWLLIAWWMTLFLGDLFNGHHLKGVTTSTI